jgi:hypothetical protein
MMITSPRTTPAVKVVLSRIALMVDALDDRKSVGPGSEATVSITEAVPSAGDKDRWVEVSTVPRGQAMKSIGMTRMMCAKNVWSVKIKHSSEAIAFIKFPTSHWQLVIDHLLYNNQRLMT